MIIGRTFRSVKYN